MRSIGYFFAGYFGLWFGASILTRMVGRHMSHDELAGASMVAGFALMFIVAPPAFTGLGEAPPSWMCISCNEPGAPRWYRRGSLLVEFFMWCLFFFPGIIYSCWRLTNWEKDCPKCGSHDMVPMDSARAKAIVADKRAKQAVRQCPTCAEEIRIEALKCKHCQADVKPLA